MASVETVNGPIDVEQLGLTLIHEHFFSSDEAVSVQWPHVRDRELEHRLAMESAEGVKSHGVKTVVEPTAMLLGRDVQASRRVADESGLQVILCTGIYTYDHLPQFLLNRPEDYIADLFVHDIERGIQGTDIKAAFIKCAADEPGVNERVEKVHRAAARASNRTGRPVMAHSRPASNTGPRQVEIFLEEGVPPECGSGWTATESICSCPPTDATPRCSSCWAAATRSGCSSRRTSTSRSPTASTGIRRR
jgi:phosphotriesterase-related protein